LKRKREAISGGKQNNNKPNRLKPTMKEENQKEKRGIERERKRKWKRKELNSTCCHLCVQFSTSLTNRGPTAPTRIAVVNRRKKSHRS
jgi:hypothetical protein